MTNVAFNDDSLGPQQSITDPYGTGDRRTLVWRGDFRKARFGTRTYRPGMFGGGTPATKLIETIEKILTENEIIGARVGISKNGYDDEDELVVEGWVLMTEDWRAHRDRLIKDAEEKRIINEEGLRERRRQQYLALKEEFEA